MDVYDLNRKAANFLSDDKIICGFGDFCASAMEIVSHILQHGGEALPGRLQYIGSCWDGSKIGSVNEIDSLYIMSDNPILIKPTEEAGFYRVCLKNMPHFELTPREMNRRFANELDRVLSADELPSFLTNAGYASPSYSGVRFNGPAVTSQFLLSDKNTLLTWDVTLAFPLREKTLRQQVHDMILPIYAENSNKLFPPWELHLVPDMVRNLWLVSTAWMEAEILRLLPAEAAVKKALSWCKAMASMLHRWNKEHLHQSLRKTTSSQSKTIQQLIEYGQQEDSTKKAELGNDLNVRMRCAHIWISADQREDYDEVEKDVVSINTAAVKHIILWQGLRTPGAFSPDNTDDLTMKLIRHTYSVLGDAVNQSSPHAFLERVCGTKIGHFSILPTSAGEQGKLIGRIQWQCRQLWQNALEEVHTCLSTTCNQYFFIQHDICTCTCTLCLVTFGGIVAGKVKVKCS